MGNNQFTVRFLLSMEEWLREEIEKVDSRQSNDLRVLIDSIKYSIGASRISHNKRIVLDDVVEVSVDDIYARLEQYYQGDDLRSRAVDLMDLLHECNEIFESQD